MAYDSEATRARLLDAAYEEFVAFGLAGARVERIAKAATANKQAIYAYFGSKDALFDAVLDTRLQVLADLVPFRPDDLPEYIGALFDQLCLDPGLLRLTQWKALERSDASESEREAHSEKATALADVLGIGLEPAVDLMMIVLAVGQAWLLTSPALRNPVGNNEAARRRRHRASVIAAVRAVASASR
ncbi:TetR/AcrR family transcriptional regulator [Agromyces bauzanensis]|uniref:TetR family regulatory protein n=1 Tax=Agromyces bauzanensis TaxID=1308924 RepID=A0A917PGH0_9MICO|nr:TetR family transcriptional regulator [Agromyces bauzanensis]GGJ76757.1 putative TetR family regulatory protein [Agromyces bauzanensis]